ncbi:flagellar hook-length control protein FliK [Massilia sp. AB1]|uniref:flagellar hook-length control protein FliK n=1 Tax=Massilia sp. AB1 TaxID=2823371 RepID=UPI001B812A32|nr:flagellar hook-length control protein FliK [Massilia sp. AB1]MBQ5942472.1 flagellar hook-length control protein FliK [Massilia sp. AB1]
MMISMNSAPMNSAAIPAVADAAAPAGPAAGAPGALPADPAQAALAFQQWLGLDQLALPADALPVPDSAAARPDSGDDIPAEDAAPADAAAAPADNLLAAMALPMMPASMPAAMPAMMMAMPGSPAPQPQGQGRQPAATAVPAAAPAPVPGMVAQDILPQAAIPAAAAPLPAAAAVLPAAQAPAQASGRPADSASVAATTAAAAPPASRDGQAGAMSLDGAAGAGFGLSAASAPAAPARTEAPVTLAGPPAAWRQSLQEALGERLQLQVGKHAEQAVIRLEPPMLGRIDISIRHAAGSLEVNISATHGEVLRQLNAVSDNLRNDLAQRQSGEVSVNVSQAPRAQPGAQAGSQFGQEPQGRGRQPGQEQERTPGQGLADAGKQDSQFSLNGRA